MNYIKQLNEFYSTLDYKPLSAEAIAIYIILLQIANKTGWIEEFKVANIILMSKCNISIDVLKNHRNKLKTLGYIDYIKGKNQNDAPKYRIIKLYETQTVPQAETQAEPQVKAQAPTLTLPYIKKQNENKKIFKSSNNEELKEHFNIIWQIYPNKKGKAKAEGYFLQWIKGRKINASIKRLTDRQMYLAVQKYKEECEEKEIHQQFIKHGDTFFNTAILDYVEENSE